MDNSSLPPLFDNMDNVDISSSLVDSEIFQSAIQVRVSFVFLIIPFFLDLPICVHYRGAFQLLAQFLRKALILRLCAYNAPFYVCWYSGAEIFSQSISGLC